VREPNDVPPLRLIRPPLPAPYLADLPELPPEQLAAIHGRRKCHRAEAAARETIERLRQLIRKARSRYEARIGARIVPELPAA
jgi:hypothetical protein